MEQKLRNFKFRILHSTLTHETRVLIGVVALVLLSTHPALNLWGNGDTFAGEGTFDQQRYLQQAAPMPEGVAQAPLPTLQPKARRLISVMMPTYNRHNFLPMQIRAVRRPPPSHLDPPSSTLL